MATIILSVLIMLVVVGAMAVGVIFSNKPIKGTCGGLNQMEMGECEICGGDPKKCDSDSKDEMVTDPKSYDVMANSKNNKLDA